MQGHEDFREYYLRTTSLVLCTALTIGIGIQFFLSHLLAPYGSKSRGINAVYIVGYSITLYNSIFATSAEQLARYVGVPSSLGLSLTRIMRIISIARGSPDEAMSWLNLGRGESRVLVKVAGMLAQGIVLALVSGGLPQGRRAALLATPEALRIGLVMEAAWRAGGTRRIGAMAKRQIAAGTVAYCVGIALSWSFEVLLWRLWKQTQALEASHAVCSLANAFCRV